MNGHEKELVREAVRETFLQLGLNPDDAQEFQRDLVWLRHTRITHQLLARKIKLALIGSAITLLTTFAVLVLQRVFGGPS